MRPTSSGYLGSRKLLVAAMAMLVAAGAAQQSAHAQDRSLAQIGKLGLQKQGEEVVFYSSVGAEPRAEQIAGLVGEARAFFQQQLGSEVSVTLAVLKEPDWRKVNPQGPYGIPYLSGSPHVIFIPATDDNVITASVLADEGGAPAALRTALNESGQSYAEWARTSLDLIALHELGHAYIERRRLNPGNKWFSELLASYHAYAFLAKKHPMTAKLWRTSTAAQISGPAPKHRSLHDFERLYLGVGPDNYGWYQALFIQQAAEIHDRHGLRFLDLVDMTFPRLTTEGDWLVSFLNTQQPIDVTAAKLQAIDPELAKWVRSTSAR